MKIIERPEYLNRLKKVIGTPDIKVITGIRRCGKSQLLEQFQNHLKSTIADANIIHFDLSLPTNAHLLSYDALYQAISERHQPSKQNFLLVDEVQLCQDFERLFVGLHSERKYDIYITGSNAFLLSSDLATLFTGRTFQVKVFPFSLREYSDYAGLTDPSEAFTRYLEEGGMPGAYLYPDDQSRSEYLSDVYDTLIVRDIIERYSLKNETLMRSLSLFLMDNISNITSARSLAQYLTSNGSAATNHNTINNYLDYLCNSFAFYKVKRYDIKGKRYLSSQDKYYLADLSFRRAVLGNKNLDYGRTYENIVAIELLRRGYEVYTGNAFGNTEVDFVALRRNEKIYFQVSDDITTPQTMERELRPLLEIRDAYPKIILANTRHETFQREGVQVVDLASWLINLE